MVATYLAGVASGGRHGKEAAIDSHDDATHRLLGWAKDSPSGTEFALVGKGVGSLTARGVALGTDPVAYRVDYELTAGPDYVTTELSVGVTGDGWWRRLDLARSGEGRWAARIAQDGDADLPPPGGDTAAFDDVLDLDVELSPLFTSLPVLRHGLHDAGEPVEFPIVGVSLPDLRLHASRQRYTYLGPSPDGAVVRLESLDADVAAEIVFDDDGLVVDYPGIGRRILPDVPPRVAA